MIQYSTSQVIKLNRRPPGGPRKAGTARAAPLFPAFEQVPELVHLGPDHRGAVSLVGVLLEKILVIILRGPEPLQGHDLGRYPAVARLLGLGARPFGGGLLVPELVHLGPDHRGAVSLVGVLLEKILV